MLALAHGENSHLRVPCPRGGDHHQVDVVAAAEVLPVALASGVKSGRRLPCFLDFPPRLVRLVGGDIANRRNAHALERQHRAQQERAPQPEADEGQPDGVASLERHARNGRRPGLQVRASQSGGRRQSSEQVSPADRRRPGFVRPHDPITSRKIQTRLSRAGFGSARLPPTRYAHNAR